MKSYIKSYNKKPNAGNFGDNHRVVFGKGDKISKGRRENKLSDMETYSTNKWDSMVDKWIEENSE